MKKKQKKTSKKCEKMLRINKVCDIKLWIKNRIELKNEIKQERRGGNFGIMFYWKKKNKIL